MKTKKNQKILENLDYEKFRALAKNKKLSKYERIGFFDEFREGQEQFIYQDICNKIPNIELKSKNILDIGCGCSDLPFLIIDKCEKQKHHLTLLDSKEMLDHLPDSSFVNKVEGKFPDDCERFITKHKGKFDVILIYSVIHYMVHNQGYLSLFDKIFSLLNNGGHCLIGDIPNISKRNRFFSSPDGILFHQKQNKTKELPKVYWNQPMNGDLDDSFIFQVMQRARLSGLESYVLPQPPMLQMANRREDILIVKA